VIACKVCAKPASANLEDQFFCESCAREELYSRALAVPSDINEHMPVLREFAEKCEHVTEFGMRWARGSTLAFLAAQPKTFISWDLNPEFVLDPRVLSLSRLQEDTVFQPRVGNTLEIFIEPTDMLFIDTLHNGRHLLSELERHCNPKDAKVKKYLAFHDTVTFGMVGEDGKPGLRTAIRQFQKFFAFPLWQIAKDRQGRLCDFENNNGLVVLEHVCAEGHSPERLRGICHWCGQIP
jgi:hypothetical protein